MLELETQITITDALSKETNLCSRFSEGDLKLIGAHVWKGYQQDLDSRAAWERRTSAAMDLALQVQKDKSFPWPNASNIAFPLVTIAALQYHSRAYPSLLKGPDLVKMRVMGGYGLLRTLQKKWECRL
jgi:chaperonin GroES